MFVELSFSLATTSSATSLPEKSNNKTNVNNYTILGKSGGTKKCSNTLIQLDIFAEDIVFSKHVTSA